MAVQLKFPVLIPYRPDGKGMIAQGGKLDGEGRGSGFVVPLFTAGTSPKAFMTGIGIVSKRPMSSMGREEFRGFLTELVNSPLICGVEAFALNPTEPDLVRATKLSPTELLMVLCTTPA